MRAIHLLGFALPVLAAGCAWHPKPTPQLAQAQQAYAQAAIGPAAQNAPRELKVARDSLRRAIRANRAGDTDRVQFAELARSRALLANQQAYTALAMQQRGLADQQLAQAQQMRRNIVAHAERQHRQLEQREAQLQQMQQQLRQRAQEQQRREQQLRQQAPAEGRTLMQPPVALLRLADRHRVGPTGTQLVFTSGMQFEKEQAILTPQAQQELDRIAEGLQSTPHAIVEIDGFADSMGSAAANQRLSAQRADAVADYLTRRGVPRTAIRARGLGSSRPLAENTTAGGRARNRRAEVTVTVPATEAPEMQPSGRPSGAQPPSGTRTPPGNETPTGP